MNTSYELHYRISDDPEEKVVLNYPGNECIHIIYHKPLNFDETNITQFSIPRFLLEKFLEIIR